MIEDDEIQREIEKMEASFKEWGEQERLGTGKKAGGPQTPSLEQTERDIEGILAMDRAMDRPTRARTPPVGRPTRTPIGWRELNPKKPARPFVKPKSTSGAPIRTIGNTIIHGLGSDGFDGNPGDHLSTVIDGERVSFNEQMRRARLREERKRKMREEQGRKRL